MLTLLSQGSESERWMLRTSESRRVCAHRIGAVGGRLSQIPHHINALRGGAARTRPCRPAAFPQFTPPNERRNQARTLTRGFCEWCRDEGVGLGKALSMHSEPETADPALPMRMLAFHCFGELPGV